MVEVQNGVALQAAQHFYLFCNNRINVVFPREILIIKTPQVLYIKLDWRGTYLFFTLSNMQSFGW